MLADPEGEGSCRIVWVHDVLPHGLAPALAESMEGVRA